MKAMVWHAACYDGRSGLVRKARMMTVLLACRAVILNFLTNLWSKVGAVRNSRERDIDNF